ncbi:MAG: type IV pilus twitching motility protein PilT [Acidimicrobiia bacterium]|nr:type IV pilus twitching motility protein PilT [Acidimicrobiia bacterium]
MAGVADSIAQGAGVVAHDPVAAADANFLAELGIDAGAGDDSGVIHVASLVESGADDDDGPDPNDPLGLNLELHVNDLLEKMLELGASDLHLTAGTPPQVRVNGDLQTLDEFGEMSPNELRRMIYAILTQKQRERFENDLELDLSHPLPGKARFRVNVFVQKESVGAVMRAIPNVVVPLDKLGLPKVVRSMAEYPRGLVLVTGPTGSGKSTTLASLVDIINQERPVHIMTVEDPIEFLHAHKKAIVNQREVGEDTHGFAPALKHVLRQDPDVILVGEMRDLETIQTALTAAETGHLVYATLHTQDAPQSIDRIIDVFPPHQQQQVRVQLATSIQAVMTQTLVRSRDGRARYVACEVMIATPAIRNLIREGKIYQIYSAMQAGGQYGMQTMDQSLADLVKANKITYEMALDRCANESDLARLCGRL